MNKKALLPFVACTVGVLVACGSSPAPKPTDVYAISITNTSEMQALWYDTGAPRTLALAISKNGVDQNPMQAFLDDEITISMSASGVVSNTMFTFSPVAPGTTTVSVKYGDKTASIDLTVTKTPSPKEIYGTDHEGNAADPFSNEDAIKVAKKDKADGYTNPNQYHVKGEIDTFYHAPGSRTDGKVSWYLKPAQEGGEQFEVYLCLKEDGTALTNDEIWKGGTATAYGAFTYYGEQMETSSAVFVSCEGNKPEPKKKITATVAEALEAGKKLVDGDSSWDIYEITGYANAKDSNGFYLTDTKGETITDNKNAFQLYGTPKDMVDLIGKGAKVKVTCEIKNYHGQIENGVTLSSDNLVIIDGGDPWVINYQDITLAKAFEELAKLPLPEAKKSTYLDGYYAVSGGIVCDVKTWSDSYKNGDAYISLDGTKGEGVTTLQLFRINDKEVFDQLVAGQTKVVVKSKLCVYNNNGVAVFETEQNPIVEVLVPGEASVEAAINSKLFELAEDGLTGSAVVNGVTFNWSKSSSTTAFRSDDADHLRVYKGASLAFVYTKEIVKIEITVTEAKYATEVVKCTIEGGTAEANDVVVTLTPSSAGLTSMAVNNATGQWRLSAVKITYKA